MARKADGLADVAAIWREMERVCDSVLDALRRNSASDCRPIPLTSCDRILDLRLAANERASCAYMKVTTLPKVLRSLENMQYPITVPAEVAARARGAIERMIAIGGRSGPALSPVPATLDPGE